MPKVLLQSNGVRGVMLLIMATASQFDLGNKVNGKVLKSRAGLGEAVRSGYMRLRALCVLLGEQIEIGAANAEEFSISLDCLRNSTACCKRSVRNG